VRARVATIVVATIAAAALAQPIVAPAGLILVSAHQPAYLRVEAEVRRVLMTQAPDAALVSIDLDAPDGPALAREALATRRGVVVAIGSRAAKLARGAARDAPLVYAMVLDPASIGLPEPGAASQGSITGVTMDVNPDREFELIREMLPLATRVGVLYDPAVSGDAVRRATVAAKAGGITLVAQAVRSEGEVLRAASLLAPSVDGLWALADPTVLTAANAKALILFSLRAQKPFFAMSEGFVRSGALAALAASPEDVGRRAGELAARVLSGTPAQKLPPEMPPRLSLFVNVSTAEHLGLTVPDGLLSRAETVYPVR
jgi:putative tryptophan/tyrosine transport system substrate-binding protein